MPNDDGEPRKPNLRVRCETRLGAGPGVIPGLARRETSSVAGRRARPGIDAERRSAEAPIRARQAIMPGSRQLPMQAARSEVQPDIPCVRADKASVTGHRERQAARCVEGAFVEHEYSTAVFPEIFGGQVICLAGAVVGQEAGS